MKKKNVVKLCVAAAVAALAVTGCGKKPGAPGAEPGTAAESSAGNTAGAEKSSSGGSSSAGDEAPDAGGGAGESSASKEANAAEPEKSAGGEEEHGVFEEFTAEDLEGGEVTAEIFKDYDVTMINVWATFCGPCLSEMPELGELSGEYQDKGLQIVGIVSDVLETADTVSAAQIEEAKSIVEKTKASYLHIVPTGDLAYTLLPQVPAVPTTVFVDKDGKQIGSAVVGARDKKSWVKIIDEKLAEVKAAE